MEKVGAVSAAHRAWTSESVRKGVVTGLGKWAAVPERLKEKLSKVLAAEWGNGYSGA
jgi:hypothetical protein